MSTRCISRLLVGLMLACLATGFGCTSAAPVSNTTYHRYDGSLGAADALGHRFIVIQPRYTVPTLPQKHKTPAKLVTTR